MNKIDDEIKADGDRRQLLAALDEARGEVTRSGDDLQRAKSSALVDQDHAVRTALSEWELERQRLRFRVSAGDNERESLCARATKAEAETTEWRSKYRAAETEVSMLCADADVQADQMVSMEHELGEARAEVRKLRAVADEALVALAGSGICTPVETLRDAPAGEIGACIRKLREGRDQAVGDLESAWAKAGEMLGTDAGMGAYCAAAADGEVVDDGILPECMTCGGTGRTVHEVAYVANLAALRAAHEAGARSREAQILEALEGRPLSWTIGQTPVGAVVRRIRALPTDPGEE